ncbi:hypothetical protein PFICI_12211 [Pestalotiopsis fici W106-1]|uniref:NADAR domain-containing protein n=1 Tax=Pestalotiopsis fici (strain W106-1 / CGMCC3.15140) TaxID=1229662 RepID=W3WSP2_PESFW|nr:uncharacterized protein PFICI_12211 [Pestalotiopsis fici W106-1]ETS76824.1 hypothetical protein PFICI_12211 [Pestalotiopsis fici W106-1]
MPNERHLGIGLLGHSQPGSCIHSPIVISDDPIIISDDDDDGDDEAHEAQDQLVNPEANVAKDASPNEPETEQANATPKKTQEKKSNTVDDAGEEPSKGQASKRPATDEVKGQAQGIAQEHRNKKAKVYHKAETQSGRPKDEGCGQRDIGKYPVWSADLSEDELKTCLVFYNHLGSHGYLSQYAKIPFREYFVDKRNNVTFVEWETAEHRMHYEKAKLFGDDETAEEIRNAKDANAARLLGREVANFDWKVWRKHRLDIGIGYSWNAGKYKNDTWGQNLLGRLLMEIRARLGIMARDYMTSPSMPRIVLEDEDFDDDKGWEGVVKEEEGEGIGEEPEDVMP